MNNKLINSSTESGIKIKDLSSKKDEKVKKMWINDDEDDIEIIPIQNPHKNSIKNPKNPSLPIVHVPAPAHLVRNFRGDLFPNTSTPKFNPAPKFSSNLELNPTPELNPTMEFNSFQMESSPIIKKENVEVVDLEMDLAPPPQIIPKTIAAPPQWGPHGEQKWNPNPNLELYNCPCTGCEKKFFRERKKLEEHLESVHGFSKELQAKMIQTGLLKISKSCLSIE